jgi:hypothetical protein
VGETSDHNFNILRLVDRPPSVSPVTAHQVLDPAAALGRGPSRGLGQPAQLEMGAASVILIFSQAQLEPTTEEVMDWIERLGGQAVRLNGEDLDGGAALTLTLDGGAGGGSELRVLPAPAAGGADEDLARPGSAPDRTPPALPLDEVKAVWFRRWVSLRRHETTGLLAPPPGEADGGAAGGSRAGPRLEHHLRRHLTLELRKLSDALFARYGNRPWLSHPGHASPAKLDVLGRASRLGLAIPASLVTTEREELRRFCACHGSVITKPIGEAEPLPDAGRR